MHWKKSSIDQLVDEVNSIKRGTTRNYATYHCIMPWSPLSKTIAAGALQVAVNETNNFQHMLLKKNCSISIMCYVGLCGMQTQSKTRLEDRE